MTEIAARNIINTLSMRLGSLPIPNKQRNLQLPLAVAGYYGAAFQSLIVGRKTKISFHRTLRIPEDGNDYPLPASLGTLPIHRVEDFAETVPEDWLIRGGFFIPLYQREALFLQFEGEYSRPTISKVCAGRINAITGKPYSKHLSSHEQDYVVIPDQKWLDGINSGKDVVRQFVAMPLGQGYTIEAQLTDEETYGGFQLEVFEPKEGRFEEPDYNVSKKVDLVVRISKSKFEAMLLQTNSFYRTIANIICSGKTSVDAADVTGLDKDLVKEIYFNFRKNFFDFVEDLVRVKFGNDRDFNTIKSKTWVSLRSLGLRDEIDPPNEPVLDDGTVLRSSPTTAPSSPLQLPERPLALYSSPAPLPSSHIEIGIAAGGRLKQQIIHDRYGVDAWDAERSRFVDIHIVNSEMYQTITGLEPLPSPVTQEQYQNSGIPWFAYYDETVKSVKAAGALSKIQGVGEIDRKRGFQQSHEDTRRTIHTEIIHRIKTPDLKEAATDFRRRAFENAAAARWKDAIREINYLIDLGLKVSASDYVLRSHCNYQMDQFFESEIDSGLALEIDPSSQDALVLKARCSLMLGDHEVAKVASQTLISFSPPNAIGYEVLAESALLRGDYKEAKMSALDALLASEDEHQRNRAIEISRLAS
jgi:hypothetical protein